MSGRLWTPLDQLRMPKWQVVLETWKYRPAPDSRAKVFDWETLQLKTKYLEGEQQRRVELRNDRLLNRLVGMYASGCTLDEVAVAFGLTRQGVTKRLKKLPGVKRCRQAASKSSEIPVLQV